MPDLSVYQNLKGYGDYDRLNQEFQLKKQLAQAELAKASQLDADKLGERAFLKAAQGLPLSEQEAAGLKYINAKSGGIVFDPVTQTVMQKPDLLTKAGLSFGGTPQAAPTISPATPKPTNTPKPTVDAPMPDISGVFGGEPYTPSKEVVLTRPDAPAPYENEFEKNYKIERDKAIVAGDRKRLQDIDTAYSKSKLEMNESESKNAGFADRAITSNTMMGGVENVGTDPVQETLSKIPMLGNYIISSDKQSLNQYQRDFVNAILRRESGAVIADSEFENARKQYFPIPGDSKETLAQKAANREEAARGIARSAGAAYVAPKVTPVKKPITKESAQVDFEIKKAGGKLIGTSGGKRVFQLPDGSHVMEE